MLQVGTGHLMLACVAEEDETAGLFGPAISLSKAEAALIRACDKGKRTVRPDTDLPFTRNAHSVFETALQVRTRCSISL
jgi:hypothetical protein